MKTQLEIFNPVSEHSLTQALPTCILASLVCKVYAHTDHEKYYTCNCMVWNGGFRINPLFIKCGITTCTMGMFLRNREGTSYSDDVCVQLLYIVCTHLDCIYMYV